ncbi:MAG: SDR family oxidoreductase [Rhodospirillaceae bacterium]|nr:SDR family oxidoreductase [Rhodospirillaceae bacterium]
MTTAGLSGKVALVTGGAGGIGAAIVERFIGDGARVMAADVAAPHPVRGGSGDPVCFRRCDVRVRTEVDAAVAAAVSTFGRIDVLVHAAAVTGGSGPFLEVAPEEWLRHIETNLTGTFHVCQAVARAMAAAGRPGCIVTIGSVNAFAAERGASPYAASKGGMWMLTRAMAVDLAPHRIRVNMIVPGPIRVERNAELFDAPRSRETFRQAIPLAGPGAPSDVAAVAAFLADDACAYMTGAAVMVDGGLMARLPL